MATVIRKTSSDLAAMAAAVNDLKAYVLTALRSANADLVSIAADSVAFATPALADPGSHNDRSESTIVSADASDLGTSLTLVNEILGIYHFHMADTLAHKTAGVALASYTRATTLATAITRANDIKSKYNTHRASTTYHYTADSTNVTSSADATDQSSLNTLLNELKADINAHVVSGPVGKSIRLVDA
jgi:hypothetical protein